MPADPPINFETLAASGGGPPYSGYPHRIKASDLMKNFIFATLDTEDGWVEEQPGQNGHTQRKLRLPPITQSPDPLFLQLQNEALTWANKPRVLK